MGNFSRAVPRCPITGSAAIALCTCWLISPIDSGCIIGSSGFNEPGLGKRVVIGTRESRPPSCISVDSGLPSPPLSCTRPLPLAVADLLHRRRSTPTTFSVPPRRPIKPVPPKGKGRVRNLPPSPPPGVGWTSKQHLKTGVEEFVPIFNPEASSSSRCFPICTCHVRLSRVPQCGQVQQADPGRKRLLEQFFMRPGKKRHMEDSFRRSAPLGNTGALIHQPLSNTFAVGPSLPITQEPADPSLLPPNTHSSLISTPPCIAPFSPMPLPPSQASLGFPESIMLGTAPSQTGHGVAHMEANGPSPVPPPRPHAHPPPSTLGSTSAQPLPATAERHEPSYPSIPASPLTEGTHSTDFSTDIHKLPLTFATYNCGGSVLPQAFHSDLATPPPCHLPDRIPHSRNRRALLTHCRTIGFIPSSVLSHLN